MSETQAFRFVSELRFRERKDNGIAVGITIANSYDNSLKLANTLAEKLLAAIAFKYETSKEPIVNILQGKRRNGMLSIEMDIIPLEISKEEAIRILVKNGFIEGFEG